MARADRRSRWSWSCGILYWAFRPTPAIVEIATVTEGTFRATVEEDGKTRVRDRYIVSAPLSGRLLRIAVKAGDEIKADSVLAWIVRRSQAFSIRGRGARRRKSWAPRRRRSKRRPLVWIGRAPYWIRLEQMCSAPESSKQRGSATAQRREREELNLQTSEPRNSKRRSAQTRNRTRCRARAHPASAL